jgi:hypothetical protein
MSVIQAQTSSRELRFVRCDDEGRLTTNLEATIDDVLMKGETAGGVKTPIRCNTDGELIVAAGSTTHNVKLEDITSSINSGITNDPTNSLAVGLRGRQTIADASTETFLKCDGSGILSVKEIGTVNGAPSNDNNSILTDSVTKANAVGLYARTDIALGSSTVPLKCSAAGVLEVSSSGGGGSASNQYNNGGTEETLSVLAPVGPATSAVTPAVTVFDMTNYKGIAINVVTTAANFSDISLGIEFSNVSNFATTLGAAYSDIQTFNTVIDVSGNPVAGQYIANILMTPEFNSQQPQAQYARATFNHSNNAGSNVSVTINAIQMPF